MTDGGGGGGGGGGKSNCKVGTRWVRQKKLFGTSSFDLDFLHNMHCTCFHSGGLVMALEEDGEYLNGGLLVEQEIVMTDAGFVVEEQDGLG